MAFIHSGMKPAPFRGGMFVASWECKAFPWGNRVALSKRSAIGAASFEPWIQSQIYRTYGALLFRARLVPPATALRWPGATDMAHLWCLVYSPCQIGRNEAGRLFWQRPGRVDGAFPDSCNSRVSVKGHTIKVIQAPSGNATRTSALLRTLAGCLEYVRAPNYPVPV